MYYAQLSCIKNLLLSLYLLNSLFRRSVPGMEIEYSGGGVLIFSYLNLIRQLNHFRLCTTTKLSRGSLIQVSSLAAALMARQ